MPGTTPIQEIWKQCSPPCHHPVIIQAFSDVVVASSLYSGGPVSMRCATLAAAGSPGLWEGGLLHLLPTQSHVSRAGWLLEALVGCGLQPSSGRAKECPHQE